MDFDQLLNLRSGREKPGAATNRHADPDLLSEASQDVHPITRPDASTVGPGGNRVDRANFDTVYGNTGGLFARTSTPAGPPTASNPLNAR